MTNNGTTYDLKIWSLTLMRMRVLVVPQAYVFDENSTSDAYCLDVHVLENFDHKTSAGGGAAHNRNNSSGFHPMANSETRWQPDVSPLNLVPLFTHFAGYVLWIGIRLHQPLLQAVVMHDRYVAFAGAWLN